MKVRAATLIALNKENSGVETEGGGGQGRGLQ